MKGLTQRQREVFDFIREFIHRNRYPPTIREIAVNFRFSVKGTGRRERPAGHRGRNPVPVPLGGDQRGHRYRPIASLTLS